MADHRIEFERAGFVEEGGLFILRFEKHDGVRDSLRKENVVAFLDDDFYDFYGEYLRDSKQQGFADGAFSSLVMVLSEGRSTLGQVAPLMYKVVIPNQELVDSAGNYWHVISKDAINIELIMYVKVDNGEIGIPDQSRKQTINVNDTTPWLQFVG